VNCWNHTKILPKEDDQEEEEEEEEDTEAFHTTLKDLLSKMSPQKLQLMTSFLLLHFEPFAFREGCSKKKKKKLKRGG